MDSNFAAHSVQAVSHAVEPGSFVRRRGIEPETVISNLKPEATITVSQLHRDRGCLRVLGGVLQRLHDREVHGGLSVTLVPADSVTVD